MRLLSSLCSSQQVARVLTPDGNGVQPLTRDLETFGPSPRLHEMPVPYDWSLAGTRFTAQGATLGRSPTGIQLQNAVDSTIAGQ